MLFQAENNSVTLGSTYMDYAVFGAGKQVMVMIPGLSTRGVRGSALSLALMYRVFAREYRVYCFDRKHDIPDGYAVWDMTEDLALAMEKLGITGADVFGVSMGGMIAQALAIRHPKLVRRLVLGVTLSRPNKTVCSTVGTWIEYAEKGDYLSINRETFSRMYSEGYLKKYRLFLPIAVHLAKPDDLRKFVIQARACVSFDAYEELDKIQCPVLVLGGCEDQVVTGEASVELAAKLGCKFHMYEGLGHAAYQEAGDFNRRILDFFHE